MSTRYLSTLVLLLCTFSNFAYAARVLEHYDLNQLCARAGLIAKVEVIDATDVTTRDGDCAVWNVKILSILKGDAKLQPTIRLAGLEEYHKGPGIKGVTQDFPRLSKGDVVYLFLVPKGTPEGYAKYNLTDADWKVIESGARLVSEDQVYDFCQYFSPEPLSGLIPGFVAATEKTFPKATVVSVQTFTKQVQGCISGLTVPSKPTSRP